MHLLYFSNLQKESLAWLVYTNMATYYDPCLGFPYNNLTIMIYMIKRASSPISTWGRILGSFNWNHHQCPLPMNNNKLIFKYALYCTSCSIDIHFVVYLFYLYMYENIIVINVLYNLLWNGGLFFCFNYGKSVVVHINEN